MEKDFYSVDAKTEGQAIARAIAWRDKDPFEDIPPALLSREHITAYARQTAMIYPFKPERKGALKPASYEINPGGDFVRWENGSKHVVKVEDVEELVLPPNSITFVQLESKIRLPNYIAIRFNLRIQHVHRGLLLGTGPLVDPGYQGDLLIPLHNLTATAYKIRTNEGLIWVEFTKTSYGHPRPLPPYVVGNRGDVFKETPPKDRKIEEFFEKANGNCPIESSIPGEIAEVKKAATKAEANAKEAKDTNKAYATFTVLAVAGLFISLFSFLQTSTSRIEGDAEKANKAADQSADAKKGIDALSEKVRGLSAEVDRSQPAVVDLMKRVDTLSAEVQAMQARLLQVTAQQMPAATSSGSARLPKIPMAPLPGPSGHGHRRKLTAHEKPQR